MSDTSTHLGLPYLLAAQAQKHVTHNEALRLLDAMVQLSVLDRTRTTPPASPADGDRHLLASGATGLWAGWDLNVAFWVDGVWLRLVPRQGWLVWIAAEQAFAVWNGSAWDPVGVPQNVSDAQRKAVESASQGVLDVRDNFPDATLADLYDPLSMPAALVNAHGILNRAVDRCYRSQPFPNDRNRVEYLFDLYQSLLTPLVVKETCKKSK